MDCNESIECKFLDDECPVCKFMISRITLPIKLL